MFMHEAEGRLEAALQVARAVEAIGRTYADLELIALAVTSQGQQLISLGRVREGLARLDEAMVSATTGELSPIVNGIVYCSVIVGCRAAYEPRRAAEWTDALKQWCDAQPDMQIFAGECRVHRAEILELHGAWDEALTELGPITTSGSDPFSTGNAWYVSAEVARLQGRYADAETNYRKAAEFGRDPQPGLALLRAVRGSTQAAATMIRTALASGSANPERPTILRAAVEILIAVDELDEARAAAQELAELADHFGSRLLAAFAQDASGRIARVGGDAATALAQLRAAAAEWQRLAAPYDLARIRTLIGKTLHELGDEESADVELAAARAVFERLGALADLAALDQLRPAAGEKAAGLTAREVEVLRLVAGGATNRAIAEQLVLSERTVDRHVSNIFAKLGVSSRTAAAAYAFERQLV
jgi:DNA-binding CsgD family transcriptional regulator